MPTLAEANSPPPDAVKVTEPTVSPFCKPLVEKEDGDVPSKVPATPYSFVSSLAVTLNPLWLTET